MKNSKQYIKPRPLQPRDHHYYTRSITFGYLIDRFVLLNFGEHSRHHKYPLESHFELHKKTFEGERRVNGWEWIKHIKSMHIRDILQTEFE